MLPRDATAALSATMVAIGIAIVIRTISAGGGATSVGILLGILFVAAGAGRLWVSSRGRR